MDSMDTSLYTVYANDPAALIVQSFVQRVLAQPPTESAMNLNAVLLGLHNGIDYPVDLQRLCCMAGADFEDAMQLLLHFHTEHIEPQVYFRNGRESFDRLKGPSLPALPRAHA